MRQTAINWQNLGMNLIWAAILTAGAVSLSHGFVILGSALHLPVKPAWIIGLSLLIVSLTAIVFAAQKHQLEHD